MPLYNLVVLGIVTEEEDAILCISVTLKKNILHYNEKSLFVYKENLLDMKRLNSLQHNLEKFNISLKYFGTQSASKGRVQTFRVSGTYYSKQFL